jgi:predicted alpha/beta superfamily hydrolase
MKPILFFFCLFMSAACSAQSAKNGQIVVGKTDSLTSKILGEKRHLWISLPGGYDEDIFTRRNFPVIYLLDANTNFQVVNGFVRQLSGINGNLTLPESIIVGILNTDRTRDLTPSHVASDPTSGGGEKFVQFLEQELIPYIDSAYHTAPFRTLIGHSFGGLTAVNILINHTKLFNAYIAVDPTMGWDDRKLLEQSRQLLAQKNFSGRSLFLGIANTMPLGMDTLRARHDTSGGTYHIRAILDTKDALGKSKMLTWSYKYYADDEHVSVPPIAEYDGLRFLFKFWKIPQDQVHQFYNPAAKIDVAVILSNYYKKISAHMGYTVLPPESMLNDLAYGLLNNGQNDKAYQLFSLIIKDYPQSFNAYDSMGDYYNAQKNKEKAIEYFRKAYLIRQFPDTKKKLDELLQQK